MPTLDEFLSGEYVPKRLYDPMAATRSPLDPFYVPTTTPSELPRRSYGLQTPEGTIRDAAVKAQSSLGDPSEVGSPIDWAMAFMGSRLGRPPIRIANPIKTFHSSPHDFSRFDISKLGSGEGGAAYGEGLYSAANPDVSSRGGSYWHTFLGKFSPEEREAAKALYNNDFNREAAINDITRTLGRLQTGGYGSTWNNKIGIARDALKLLQSDQEIIGPRTYKVNIHARPENLIDWDASVANQPPNVRAALNDIGALEKPRYGGIPIGPTPDTGEDVYRNLAKVIYQQKNYGGFMGMGAEPTTRKQAELLTSTMLNEAGIPGHRFLDAGSRLGPTAQMHLERAGGDYEAASKNIKDLLTRIHQQYPKGPDRLRPVDIITQDRMLSDALHQLKVQDRTHNYVMYGDELMEISKKFGIPLGIGLGGLASGQYGGQNAP